MSGAAVAPDRFVVIGWAFGLPDGAMALSALQAASIPAHYSAWHFASVAPHGMVALGGMDLRVPADLAPIALEILAIGDAPSACRGAIVRRLCIALLFLVTSVPPPARGFFLRTTKAVSIGDMEFTRSEG